MAFLRAARKDEIPAGSIREFQVDGKTLAIANVGGEFFAIDNTCLHRGGPLAQGPLNGKVVTCPWHAWQYDVTTGKVAQNPAVGVACYALEVRGEDIFADCG
jgi:nitrite reductase (NADH) small subunit/3-phenylpropionate/trans-cinnamate dioxygenase ferredoxin subunit